MARSEPVSVAGMLADPRVVTLSSSSFVGTLGGSLVAPALPVMATALGVSDASIGLVMAAYSLPGLVAVPVLSVVADIHGRRPLFPGVLAGFGAAGVLVALAGGFAQVLLLRVLQGVFGGVIISLTITILGDLYSGARGTTAQGIRLSANGVSRIVVPSGAGLLAGVAWQAPFLGYALALIVALLAYLTIPETVETTRDGEDIRVELRRYVGRVAAEISSLRLGVLTLGSFFQGFGWFALLTFVPVFAVRTLAASPFEAGLVLSVVGVLRLAVAPYTAHLLLITTRRGILLVGLGCAVLGAGLIPFAPSVAWLAAFVGCFALGDSLFTPAHRDALTVLARDSTRAGTIGANSMLRKIGTSTSPVVFGLVLAVGGFGPLFWGASAVFAVYAVALLTWYPRERLAA